MPRSQCGPWPLWMVLASNFSNSLIAAAYFYLTYSIFRFWLRKREVLPYAWVLIGFQAFIFTCGLTHVCNVLAFHWPAYRLFLAVDIVCAALSLATAAATPFAVSYLLGWKPPEEVSIIRERAEVLERKRRARFHVLRNKRAERNNGGNPA